MECYAIFGEGNLVCETAIVSGIIRDVVIVITTLIVSVVGLVAVVMLFKAYRAVKRTTDRINAVVDKVESGIDSLKPIGEALQKAGSMGAGSAGSAGASAIFGGLKWVVRSLFNAATKRSRSQANDQPADEAK